jgi:hypothetical protein
LTVIAPSGDLPVKVLGPATAGVDAEPPPAVDAVEDPLAPVAAGDAAVDEAPAMMDDASDGEMVTVLVL